MSTLKTDLKIKIASIFGGIAPTAFFANDDQYLDAYGIDPDEVVGSSTNIRTSGAIVPIVYQRFSTRDNVNAVPKWILTTPKDDFVYVYLDGGTVATYSSTLASESVVGVVTNSSANGAAYYNNFLYFAKDADIARYGPLNGTPTFTQAFWTSTLGLTALANGDSSAGAYPFFNDVRLPNHPMYEHFGTLYIGDFDSTTTTDTTAGRGLIHAISTKYGTAEGTANDDSRYNVLDLPYGYMPTAISSYADFLAIAAIQSNATTSNALRQGTAAIFLWDTTSQSPTLKVDLPDPLCTALLNSNGILYGWSGNLTGGYRFFSYTGGHSVNTLGIFEQGLAPLAGAVDKMGDRIVWGTTERDRNIGTVMAYGYKNPNFPKTIHNIAVTTAGSTSPITAALKYVEQPGGFTSPRLVLGWRSNVGGASIDYGIDKKGVGSGTFNNYWTSKIYTVGKRFIVKHIRFALDSTIAAGQQIRPTIFTDTGVASTALTVINNSNFPNSERIIHLYPNVIGSNDFYLQLNWDSTSQVSILLPIEIDLEIVDENT